MAFNPTGFWVSSDLRSECLKLFEQCDEFSSPEKFRSFASLKELAFVERCIPRSRDLDPEILFTNMLTTGRSRSDPALFDLLDALVKKYELDFKGEECKELREKLRTALLQADSPEQAEDYERLVVHSAPSDVEGKDQLAKRWIEGAGDDLDELTLRITLAVFSGTTFEVIEKAKNDLLELLQQLLSPTIPNPESPVPAVSYAPLMRRLEKAGAKETAGKAPDWKKVIELEDVERASEAIGFVWQLHREPRWRQKLIEWLTTQAAGRSADVRTRVAVAAGRLALRDYRFVRDNLLMRWVEKNEAVYRTAIGMALGVLVREQTWVAEVQNLLWKWSKSPKEAERWAAVRAYIFVGAYLRPVSDVIGRWRDIAGSQRVAVASERGWTNDPMRISLMDAMMRFFVHVAQQPSEERRSLLTGILEGLKKWIADNGSDAGLGFFMFLTLARMTISPIDNAEANSPPMLLQLVDQETDDSDYRRQLAALFELTMSRGSTIVEVKELLCAWLRWINGLGDNSQYETRIRTLLADIIATDSSGRMRGRLSACLRECGRNQAVERVLSGL
jgi:hypothetical protein